jgi:hypothetical protein
MLHTLSRHMNRPVLLWLRGGQHARGLLTAIDVDRQIVSVFDESVSPSTKYIRIEAIDSLGTDAAEPAGSDSEVQS